MSDDGLERRIALNSWTVEGVPLRQLVALARSAGYGALELRSTDFATGDEEAVLSVRGGGLAIASIGAEGILVQPTAAAQANWFRRLGRTCALARRVGCGILIVSTGMENPVAVGTAGDLLAEAADIAAESRLAIAYEFNALHPSLASLPAALTVLDAARRTNLGLALDAYHLQRSAGSDALDTIDPACLLAVQISDVPPPDGPDAAPFDRLRPGLGVIDWRRFFAWLDRVDYRGFVSFEAPNPAQWRRDPQAVAAEGLNSIAGLWRASRASHPLPKGRST